MRRPAAAALAASILLAGLTVAPAAAEPAGRWRCDRPVIVYAGAGVNVDYLTRAIRVMVDATGLQMRLARPGESAQVTVARDYAVDGGWAWVRYDSNRVALSAEVKIGPEEWANLYAHELGHVVGLEHSTNRRDMMHPSARANEFQPAERAALAGLGCPQEAASARQTPERAGCWGVRAWIARAAAEALR